MPTSSQGPPRESRPKKSRNRRSSSPSTPKHRPPGSPSKSWRSVPANRWKSSGESFMGRWEPIAPKAPDEGMDAELVSDHPPEVTKFLQSKGIQSCSSLKYAWNSGAEFTAAYEQEVASLEADAIYQMLLLYALAAGQPALAKQEAIRTLADERESVIAGRAVLIPPSGPTQPAGGRVRSVIDTGLTSRVANLVQASDQKAEVKEKAKKQMKTQALFQFVLGNLLDLDELGITWEMLNDPARLQVLWENLMACAVRLSLERLGALLAAIRRWTRFACARQYPTRTPSPLMLAEFLREVGAGGPTAAACSKPISAANSTSSTF